MGTALCESMGTNTMLLSLGCGLGEIWGCLQRTRWPICKSHSRKLALQNPLSYGHLYWLIYGSAKCHRFNPPVHIHPRALGAEKRGTSPPNWIMGTFVCEKQEELTWSLAGLRNNHPGTLTFNADQYHTNAPASGMLNETNYPIDSGYSSLSILFFSLHSFLSI